MFKYATYKRKINIDTQFIHVDVHVFVKRAYLCFCGISHFFKNDIFANNHEVAVKLLNHK